jgi:hypothetical protein
VTAIPILIAFALFATGARAQPLPLPKTGPACPSNYTVSGSYCVPNQQARDAIPKLGSVCPFGYYVSGQYCVSQQDRRR